MRDADYPPKDRPYMSNHGWFSRAKAEFIHPLKGLRITIVDDRGNILGFPGIANPEIVLQLLEGNSNRITPHVHYGMEFHYQPDGTHLVQWELQPDGQYWADDGGFGMENDDEIQLYSYLDQYGNFTAPFRLHHVGDREYFGTDREEQLVQQYHQRKESPFEKSMDQLLPGFLKRIAQELEKPERQQKDLTFRFRIDGVPRQAVIEFQRGSRGAIEFYLERDEEACRGLPHYVALLTKGPPHELKCYLAAETTPESIKYHAWEYCCEVDSVYEMFREKYGRR